MFGTHAQWAVFRSVDNVTPNSSFVTHNVSMVAGKKGPGDVFEVLVDEDLHGKEISLLSLDP